MKTTRDTYSTPVNVTKKGGLPGVYKIRNSIREEELHFKSVGSDRSEKNMTPRISSMLNKYQPLVVTLSRNFKNAKMIRDKSNPNLSRKVSFTS